MPMDLAAVAAFSAAGLSVVNILISAWLTRRGRLAHWRREQTLPVVASILTLSADVLGRWMKSAQAKDDAGRLRDAKDDTSRKISQRCKEDSHTHWEAARPLWASLRYEVAKLDLIGTEPLLAAATKLVQAHEIAEIRLNPNRPGVVTFGPDDPLSAARHELAQAAKQLFGTDMRRKKYTRYFLGRIFGRKSHRKSEFSGQKISEKITV